MLKEMWNGLLIGLWFIFLFVAAVAGVAILMCGMAVVIWVTEHFCEFLGI